MLKPEIVKIICPSCKKSFDATIRNRALPVRCPIRECGYAGLISEFSPASAKGKGKTEITDPDSKSDISTRPAVLILKKTDGYCKPEKISLAVGKNSIGRMADSSKCTVQLDTDDEYMSRNHASIDFIKRKNETFEYRLSNHSGRNGTYLNGKKLEEGDVLLLSPNDEIRLGHTTFIVSTG